MMVMLSMLLTMVVHMSFGVLMFFLMNVTGLNYLGVLHDHFVLLDHFVPLATLMLRLCMGLLCRVILREGLFKLSLQVLSNALGGMTSVYLAAILQGNSDLLYGSKIDRISTCLLHLATEGG